MSLLMFMLLALQQSRLLVQLCFFPFQVKEKTMTFNLFGDVRNIHIQFLIIATVAFKAGV